ncbi:MAG: bifunctional DNA-formamidopyrimidine glycosylase/DNA-(apurinic or apyrimidinic site) lyase [Phycisphaerales bacterium]
MPELPEVESVRRSLQPHLLGVTVRSVMLRRRDIVTGPSSPAALLAGETITHLDRRGKQLALIAASGRALIVQLGMSGQFFFRAAAPAPELTHVHALWTLPRGQLVFRDPRRFGGLTTLASAAALTDHWTALGPDALTVQATHLVKRLATARRAIKAALLDQAVLAGVGNIYADEALFFAAIAPTRRADRLSAVDLDRLAGAIRQVLAASIASGGSTLRDFLDGDGRPGAYRDRHAVYGRAGQPCRTCATKLRSGLLAQRTTVWCPTCQPRTPPRLRVSTNSPQRGSTPNREANVT